MSTNFLWMAVNREIPYNKVSHNGVSTLLKRRKGARVKVTEGVKIKLAQQWSSRQVIQS